MQWAHHSCLLGWAGPLLSPIEVTIPAALWHVPPWLVLHGLVQKAKERAPRHPTEDSSSLRVLIWTLSFNRLQLHLAIFPFVLLFPYPVQIINMPGLWPPRHRELSLTTDVGHHRLLCCKSPNNLNQFLKLEREDVSWPGQVLCFCYLISTKHRAPPVLPTPFVSGLLFSICSNWEIKVLSQETVSEQEP